MTVYLGAYGEIELQRQFDEDPIVINLRGSDINATKNRFSVRFASKADLKSTLLTGDQVEIKRVGGGALDLITGNTSNGVKKFIHIDQVGGMFLYNTFAHAVTGGSTNAVALSSPSSNYDIELKVKNARVRSLAQITNYELNTERETVDTTTLSDEFRTRVSSLMSGSGQLTCFWDYTGNTSQELPQYLAELALRSQVGSGFRGRFYLKKAGFNPSGVSERLNDAVWYECDAILTAVAMQFPLDNTVQMTASFITTSQIELKMDLDTVLNLVQEDDGKLVSDGGNEEDLSIED